MFCTCVVTLVRFIFCVSPPFPFFAPAGISRDLIIQCFSTIWGRNCAFLLPRPFALSQKKTVLCSTRKYALSWKVPERSSIFGCRFGFLPCCRILKWPLWLLFALLPPATACQIRGTFEKFSVLSSAQSARVSANRCASGVPTRWACASQPGFPPLRAQFRFGIPHDWSRPCFSV